MHPLPKLASTPSMSALGLALVLFACEAAPSRKPAPPSEPEHPSESPRADESVADQAAPADERPVPAITWTLEVEPARFTLAELDEVVVRFSARNDGATTIEPPRPWDLRVDGEPSMSLSLAFGNGVSGPKWRSLPPGETATDERVGMAFVEAAGDHLISLHDGDRELARTSVHVKAGP